MFSYRLPTWPVFVATTVAAPSPTQADVKACIDSHARGQELEISGNLLGARDSYQTCLSIEGCPEPIRTDCGGLAQVLAPRIPSVLFVVREDGKDLTQVRVLMDGEPLLEKLEAQSVPVNPGQHTFVFIAPDGDRLTRDVVVREGERARRIEVQFEAEEVAPVQRPEQPAVDAEAKVASVWPWVLGGVGAVSAGIFGYFALEGRAAEPDLEQCMPRLNCDPDRVEERDRLYLVADIALGVSVVSFSSAAMLWFLQDGDSEAPPSGNHDVAATVTRTGVQIGLRGRF